MTSEEKEITSAWPVVIHKMLTSPDVVSMLRQRNFVIRTSESVVPGSVIFPLSAGVAFLIIPLDQVTSTDPVFKKLVLTSELTERVDNFIKVHRYCFLLCKAPIHGDVERRIFSLIQQRYLTTNLQMMPVHNVKEAVTCMVTLAKRPAIQEHFGDLSCLARATKEDYIQCGIEPERATQLNKFFSLSDIKAFYPLPMT